ncbi:aminoacetone oxidase family FAD-binding enzyme [Sporanaerobium hydrogeniformans]|uniref:Aminoacetone oxidase family FAD-binding enzyme n=1 Tax=Sporanaerobium hydrogeniformans TaxID=3072179 RepID=A0AC61DFL0_9FIRM|nr:NAD(P)/FAD-dependent oxidoreductase [Sporanaerobium hydrogeniformans]PHV71675.1 aminoacetone oxidase family FAD-binding enzyme [Sporanaerobium hydrogeniformans]
MVDIIVVGGGAAGMIASIVAARQGAEVLLLERLNRVGKKLLVTGNGRCNLTNIEIEKRWYHTSGKADFSYPLNDLDATRTRIFFEELGIVPLIEGKKVYPLSEQASSVLDVLRMEMKHQGVKEQTDTHVIRLKQKEEVWELTAEDGATYKAPKVIWATGGLAGGLSFGCSEEGYMLLKPVGHSVIKPFPTLVHLVSNAPYCKMLKGTKIKAKAAIWIADKERRKEYGEVLFTEDGLSGPPIFQLSRLAGEASLKKQSCEVKLDLFPEEPLEDLVSKIYERIARHPERSIEELFIGFLHKRLVLALMKYAEITSIHRSCEGLEYEEIMRLVEGMKAFCFKIQGTRSFKHAQATAGGISIDEIDLETMASKKAKGLYLAGEVLDIDGDCGGFNLQWAWSSGYLAGLSASRKNEE